MVGWPASIPASSSPPLCAYVEDNPPVTHWVPWIHISLCCYIPCQCHTLWPKSHDLLISCLIQHGISFNFWLHAYPLFKHHSTFIHGFPSFTLQSSSNSFHHTAIDQHVQSRWPQVHIWGFLWHRDGGPHKPKCILKLKQSIRSLQSTWHEQCPIMALPIEPQPTSNDITITPIIPTDPLFPSHLWSRDHIIWERTSQKLGWEHTLSG